jgi:hypothetical protein
VREAVFKQREGPVRVPLFRRLVVEVDTGGASIGAVRAVLPIAVRSPAPLGPALRLRPCRAAPCGLLDVGLQPVVGDVDLLELLLGRVPTRVVVVNVVGRPSQIGWPLEVRVNELVE